VGWTKLFRLGEPGQSVTRQKMRKQKIYCSGPLMSEADVTRTIADYRAVHPGCWFGIVVDDEDNFHVYGFPSGHSHAGIRTRTTHVHARQQYSLPVYCFVLGKCHKTGCCCGGSTYVSQAVRSPDPLFWDTEQRGHSNQFAEDDLDGLLAFVFERRRRFELRRKRREMLR
jgi:hypothetical protein